MSTLHPGEATKLAARLRALMAKSEDELSSTVRSAQAPTLETDDAGLPPSKVNNEAGDNTHTNDYTGPVVEGYGGGHGPRIGAIYDNQ